MSLFLEQLKIVHYQLCADGNPDRQIYTGFALKQKPLNGDFIHQGVFPR